MKTRILFVDDEPLVLQGLKRLLRPMRQEWEMTFVTSGSEALEELKKERFEVIVTDMRMPGMDGADLLNQVMIRYPWVVRIVLSGESDQRKLLKSARPAHQFLSKPCDPEVLKATVARTRALREVVTNEAVREVVSRLDHIPSLPEVYNQVVWALETDDVSTARVGRIISRDPGMTTAVLKIVNSSFFGTVRKISDPVQAVSLLGLEIISGLILSAHLMSVFKSTSALGFSLDTLWGHCFATAKLAKMEAATTTTDKKLLDDCYIAGLLHDVGKLIIGINLTEEYKAIQDRIRSEGRPAWEIETELLGSSHAQVGAYLLGLWGLPETMVEAVAFHHNPSQSLVDGFTALTAIHVADHLEHKLIKTQQGYAVPEIDQDFLTAVGFLEKLPQWQAMAEAHVRQVEDGEGKDSPGR